MTRGISTLSLRLASKEEFTGEVKEMEPQEESVSG